MKTRHEYQRSSHKLPISLRKHKIYKGIKEDILSGNIKLDSDQSIESYLVAVENLLEKSSIEAINRYYNIYS